MTPPVDAPPRTKTKLHKRTILHVEDEEAYQYALRHRLRQEGVGYHRVELLSEAAEYIHDELVVGIVVDLILPEQQPEDFAGWGRFDMTPIGLIQKIMQERPDVPVAVLSKLYRDDRLQPLFREQLLVREDIFSKVAAEEETCIRNLVARLFLRRSILKGMDPSLQYVLEAVKRGYRPRETGSTRAGEVAVFARVDNLPAWQAQEGVRPGIAIPKGREWIVTGRIRVDCLEALHGKPFVLSLKMARRLYPTLGSSLDCSLARPPHLPALRAEGLGRDVLVAIVDHGCDFAHPHFRRPDGSSRLLALSDQRSRTWSAEEINDALKTEKPYAALGYDPDLKAHGTHVMDISAGGGTEVTPAGVAPDADLIFLEIAASDIPWDEILDRPAADDVQFAEALARLFEMAGDRPCIVNVSLGTNLGPHDGTSAENQAVDALVGAAAPNRSVVFAAGNSHDQGHHAIGSVPDGGSSDLSFRVQGNRKGPVMLEVWYGSEDLFLVELISPKGTPLCQVQLGGKEADDYTPWRSTYFLGHARDQDNGDHFVALFLGPGAEPGDWRLRLHGSKVQDGSFHAWIEDHRRPPSAFFLEPELTCTLSSTACAQEGIVVGSCNGHKVDLPTSIFSGAGPTRDGRLKPDLCAPGEAVRAACSRSPEPIEMTGTSLAAPVVTGVVALMLAEAQILKRPLSSSEVRQILHSTARQNLHPGWENQRGYGVIDARKAIRKVQGNEDSD